MGVRVEPHAYPTIPGQATNESGGGGIPVQYLNLDNLAAKIEIPAKSYSTWSISRSGPNSGIIINVSGIEIIDLAGLSIIEEFDVSEITVSGPEESNYPSKATKNAEKFAYAVGTTPNRLITKQGYDSLLRDGVEYDRSVNFKKASIQLSGSATVTVKVVNPMGAVLQVKQIRTETLEMKEVS